MFSAMNILLSGTAFFKRPPGCPYPHVMTDKPHTHKEHVIAHMALIFANILLGMNFSFFISIIRGPFFSNGSGFRSATSSGF